MRKISLCTSLAGVAALVALAPALAAPIIWDSFEPGIQQPPWYKYPAAGHILEGSSNHVFSGSNAMLAQPNWRYAYSAYRGLPSAYAENIYYSAWVYDDAVIPPGLPGPPDNPYWTSEHVPNAAVRLDDSNGFDYLHLVTKGKIKTATNPQWAENIYFSVESAYEGTKLLSGAPTSPVPVRREPGWRKWMIRVKPYTGAKGDAEYYLDGQLVYSGYRSSGPMGAATYDRIGIGSDIWTAEWYWYDEVEFGEWPAPADVTSVDQALSHADGDWVRLVNFVIEDCYPDAISAADSSGARVTVYPARFEAPGDVVTVVGRLATSDHDRYIDALTVDRVTVSPLVQVDSIGEARALPDGTRVRLPESLVTASLGPVRFLQQAGDRACGIKVRNIYEPNVGDKVVVEGQVMTVGPEKLLEAEKVTILTRGNTLPAPVGVANKALYPPSTIPSGMLVVTTGRVVNRPGPGTWYPAWCEIVDGSQSASDLPVRIVLPDYRSCPQIGDYVWVEGAAGWLIESVGARPQLYCRYTSDIRVLQYATP